MARPALLRRSCARRKWSSLTALTGLFQVLPVWSCRYGHLYVPETHRGCPAGYCNPSGRGCRPLKSVLKRVRRLGNLADAPSLLLRSWDLVEDAQSDSIVGWTAEGASFVVSRPAELASDILPKYFKHNNFSSFVRQLNTYVRRFSLINPASGSGQVPATWQQTLFCPAARS
jgi:HSF-type DNA-binding